MKLRTCLVQLRSACSRAGAGALLPNLLPKPKIVASCAVRENGSSLLPLQQPASFIAAQPAPEHTKQVQMHSPFNAPRLALDKRRRTRTTFTVSPKAAQIGRKCRFHGVRTIKSTQITNTTRWRLGKDSDNATGGVFGWPGLSTVHAVKHCLCWNIIREKYCFD